MVKKLLALFLVVLMSINTFGTVVSDNDGSAFITKAEFDSLKNNFQSQIDQYNTSIDSKIDGAIASYLAGITVAKVSTLVDMITPAKNKNAYNVGFVRWETPNTTRDVPDVSAGFYWNRLWRSGYGSETEGKWRGGYIISNGAAWAGNVNDYRYHNWDQPAENYDSYYYLVNFPFGQQDTAVRRTINNTSDWTLTNANRNRCTFNLRNLHNGFNWGGLTAEVDEFNNMEGARFLSDFTPATKVYSYGPGFGSAASGTTSWYGSVTPTLYISHAWSTWTDTTSGDADTKRKALKLNYLIGGTMSGTAKGVDFAFRDSYTSANPYEYQIAYTKPEVGTDASKSGTQISLARYKSATNSWEALHSIQGWSSNVQNVEFVWKWNRQTIYNLNWDRMTQEYYNGVLSEPYYKYVGIPICRTPNKPGKLRFKLRFTNKVLTTGANLTPDSASNGYVYVITDKKFKNTSLPTTGSSDSYWRDSDGYDHVFLRKWVDSGSYEHTTDWIEIDKTKIIDTTNGDYIYLKVAALTNDQVVSVQVVDNITYTEE